MPGGQGYQTEAERNAAQAAYQQYGPGSSHDYTHHGGGSSAPGTVAPPDFNNTAQNDPGYDDVLNAMWAREKGDAGAGQAIDLAGGKIREAGIGAGKELGASLAARGVSGTGADTLARTKLAGQVQGNIAGAAADIANQREREKDAELNAIGGVIGGRANANLANRQLGLQQWEGVRADQRAQEQQQSAQQLAILQLLASQGQQPFAAPYPGGGGGGAYSPVHGGIFA